MKFLLLLFLFSSPSLFSIETIPLVTWTMINVNSRILQGDAHLLELPEDQVFLIDAGDNEEVLVSYLKSRKIKKIDKVFISHMHRDHYAGLESVLKAGIIVKNIYYNIPDKSVCDSEKPWGCDWKDIARFAKILKKNYVLQHKSQQGDVYYDKDGVSLKVLYAFDSLKSPIGKVDVNDTSVLMRLTVGKTRVLFTGDLNQNIGQYLSDNSKELKADILKVPHHGTESVVPNAFFDKVGAKVVLIPSPKTLWFSDRSKRIRDYFTKEKTESYINGINGHVTVTFKEDKFSIVSERQK